MQKKVKGGYFAYFLGCYIGDILPFIIVCQSSSSSSINVLLHIRSNAGNWEEVICIKVLG